MAPRRFCSLHIVLLLTILLVWSLAACTSVKQGVNDARGKLVNEGIICRNGFSAPSVLDCPSAFFFTALPVPIAALQATAWYGNTTYAYAHRCDSNYYRETQGLHSGIDLLVPVGTTISNVANVPGTVISIGNSPFNYGADYAVVVDYGTVFKYLVVYGHVQKDSASPVGKVLNPGDTVALSGVGEGVAHLHLEVIIRDNATPAGAKPGNVRINALPLFSKNDQDSIGSKKQFGFQPTKDGKWQTPGDQPDINPGGPQLVGPPC